MWIKYLEKEGFNCLYFNAWENDFSDDPLISFIGEMQSIIDELDNTKKPKAKKYLKKVKEVSYSLVKQMIPVAARIGTSGVLNLDSLTEKAISDFSARIAEEKIDSYKTDKMAIKEFRKNLEDLVRELAKLEAGENRPLIFFIDELDRCKPTYAIELLERVKHLFNVRGIIFVLVLDKEHIAHSFESLYGIKNVDGYLRRFIDLDYHLPDPSSDYFCRYLYQRFGFKEFFESRLGSDKGNDSIYLLDTFIELSQVFDFSLRIQEQCFTQFSIALRTTDPSSYLFPILLATLIALKVADKSLYKKYINGDANYKDVLGYIKGKPKGIEFVEGEYGGAIEAYMVYSSCVSAEEYVQKYNEYKNKAAEKTLSEEQRGRINNIMSILQSLEQIKLRNRNVLSSLANKIEISEQFVW